jgi:hypothetical protein
MELLQLGEFCLRLLQDGNVVVGVFPEREEIQISYFRFRRNALYRIRTGEAQMEERANRFIHSHSAVVENFLELGYTFAAAMCQ